jgi:hypothetical protein
MAVAYFTMSMARVLRVSIAFLIVFLALSSVADRGRSRLHVITGTATEWHAHELIAVANDTTDPKGVRIALRETVYDGDTRAIQPGVPAPFGTGESARHVPSQRKSACSRARRSVEAPSHRRGKVGLLD